MVVWFAVRVAYWNGYYTEDAPGYVTDAIWMALGQYRARDYVNGLNVGTYLPVSIPILLLGKSEAALSVWPMACSLLGMLSLTALSALMFGRGAGLLAAGLYATYPGDVFFSTVVMPDAPQAAWLSFSLLLIALAYSRPDRKAWLLAGGGVAMGICHLIRANDVVLVPVGVAAVIICSTIWEKEPAGAIARSCAAYLSGIAAIYAIEGIAYLSTVGDFLHRLNVVARHYGSSASIAQAGLNIDPWTIPYSIFPPVHWWRHGWGPLNHEQAFHGLLFCWALLSLLLGGGMLKLARPDVPRRAAAGFAIAAVWFAWPLLYHQVGSQSITAYVPMHRLSRHLVVYAPGAIFAVVAGCYLAGQTVRRSGPILRRGMLASGLALLAIHLTYNWQAEQIAHGAYQRIKGTYIRIRQHLPQSVRTIVADPGDLCFFDFWLNPLGREVVKPVPFASVSRCQEIDGVVLTFSNPGWVGLDAPIIRETVERLPCLIQPPSHWRLLYDGYPEKVYVTGSREDLGRAWLQ